MRIEVRLFAAAKQLVGRPVIVLELPAEANVGDLKRALAQACPTLATMLRNLRIAVDAEYAEDHDLIPPNSEIAVIPPVSGG